jgi:hypothetical protein
MRIKTLIAAGASALLLAPAAALASNAHHHGATGSTGTTAGGHGLLCQSGSNEWVPELACVELLPYPRLQPF